MTGPHLLSVNVGTSRRLAEEPALVSSIDKRPVPGPVRVRHLGLEGDSVTNHRHHGGTYQALYAYAVEEYSHWAGELGVDLGPGAFGENLTTRGIDLDACVVGERWQVGACVLAVSTVRIPCGTFASWMRVQGAQGRGWTGAFTRRGSPGVYLRVLHEGEIRPGDAITVLDRPEHGLDARTAFRALTGDQPAMARFVEAGADLPPREVEKVRKRLVAAPEVLF